MKPTWKVLSSTAFALLIAGALTTGAQTLMKPVDAQPDECRPHLAKGEAVVVLTANKVSPNTFADTEHLPSMKHKTLKLWAVCFDKVGQQSLRIKGTETTIAEPHGDGTAGCECLSNYVVPPNQILECGNGHRFQPASCSVYAKYDI